MKLVIVDDKNTRVIRENKKYRILRLDSLEGMSHHFDVRVNSSARLQLQIKGTILKLKERFWFFGWCWRTIEITNQSSIGKKWVKTYFKGKKL